MSPFSECASSPPANVRLPYIAKSPRVTEPRGQLILVYKAAVSYSSWFRRDKRGSREFVVALVWCSGGRRNSMQPFLWNQDVCVLTAATREEALAISPRFIDKVFVISDVGIGGMTNQELYTRVREHRPEAQVLFVAGDVQELQCASPVNPEFSEVLRYV